MASDWRVVPEPLGRLSCDGCGLAVRPPAREIARLFERGYRLYAHAPGHPREVARQAIYAKWIAEQIETAPRQIVDVGCGNGSLLLALAAHWPGAALFGCDLSDESVAHGATAGLALWSGGLSDRPSGVRPDLVVSVNVIEHTANPEAFLDEIRHTMASDGVLVLVCPDGSRPGVELLMADHLYSFTADHLAALLGRVGLRIERTSIAPEDAGAFQMVTARPGPTDVTFEMTPPPDLLRRRQAYLEGWRNLDARLQDRVPQDVTCFGVGETTGLLGAYAPRVWSAVKDCTSDEPTGEELDGLPVRSLGELSPDRPILLGVRPRDQRRVAERLRRTFRQVITWFDLVDEP